MKINLAQIINQQILPQLHQKLNRSPRYQQANSNSVFSQSQQSHQSVFRSPQTVSKSLGFTSSSIQSNSVSDSIDFSSFKLKQAAQTKTNNASVTKSVQEWSTEIQQNLCKGLYDSKPSKSLLQRSTQNSATAHFKTLEHENSARWRLFKSKDKVEVKNMISQRIQQQCLQESQIDVAFQPAIRKCHMLQTTRSSLNRHQLMRQIIRRQSPPRLRHNQTNTEHIVNHTQEMSESEAKDVERKLWLQLHKGLRPIGELERGQDQLKYFNKMVQPVDSQEQRVPSALQRMLVKYESLEPDQAQIFAERDYKRYLQLKNDEKTIMKAATTRVTEPWTTQRVIARQMTNVSDQIRILMDQKNELLSNEDLLIQQFEVKVNRYVEQLRKGRLKYQDSDSSNDLTPRSPSKARLSSQLSLTALSPRGKQKQKYLRMASNRVMIESLDFCIKKVQQPFDYQQIEEKLIQKLAFQLFCKASSNQPQKMAELMKDDPRQKYFEECKSKIEHSLDILSKVQDQQLALEEFSLQAGCCHGFMHACELVPQMITKVIVDNCSIDQKAFPHFLQGLNYQKKVSRLCLKNISLSYESAQQIQSLISKPTPNNLQDLMIENVEMTIDSMSLILQSLIESNFIVKLAIVAQELTQNHINQLCNLAIYSTTMTDIDLSYSKVSAISFLPLLQAICRNQRLVHINLSWVKLLKGSNFGVQNEPQKAMSPMSPLSQGSFRNKTMSSFQSEELNKGTQHTRSVQEALVMLLSNNTKLFHLDLSETGLDSDTMLRLIRPIRDAQSLIGVHLSGNPGTTEFVENKFLCILRATYEPQLNLKSFNQILERSGVKRSSITSHKLNQALHLKQLQNQKRLELQTKIDRSIGRHFILTRKIGHHLEIPGSQEWVLHKETQDQCYICDRKVYAVFFWSPTIGKIEGYDLGLTPEEQHKIANQILCNRDSNLTRKELTAKLDPCLQQKIITKVIDPKINDYIDQEAVSSEFQSDDSFNSVDSIVSSNDHLYRQDGPAVVMKRLVKTKDARPYLYGQFNNWQPQPMIKVSKIAMALDTAQEPDYLETLKNAYQCREQVSRFEEMNRKEKDKYVPLYNAHQKRFYKDEVWTKALMKLIPYREPHYANVVNLKHIKTDSLYVAANFIGSGRQDFVVGHGNKFYFHQTIADFRRQEIVLQKLTKTHKVLRERNPNVFQNWISETPQLIEECANKDFEYWKVPNFIKDPGDRDVVQNIIRKNYTFLSNVFTQIAAKSLSYPCASQLEFGCLIQELGLLDKVFTQGICDTQFIASRTDAEKKNNKAFGQNALDINRFEFLECIVRIANIKFKQTGQAATVGQAVKMFIECLKPLYAEKQSIQDFRYNQLWVRDVNLTLDANLKGIKQIYDFCAKGKSRRLSIQEAIQLMTKDTRIKLSDTDAYFCYAYCKQSLADIVKHSQVRTAHLDLIEFYELIGRVADTFYCDEEIELHEKIDRVLDEWLKLVCEVRQEPQRFEDNDSDLE